MEYRLKPISPLDIEFNTDNPRGESLDEIQNDESFEKLKDSVYKFGVLVPVVVYEQKGKPKRYKLVDGERRVRAAIETNTKTIPAHVAGKEDKLDELVQAFHIHMLREQWRPVAQARALKNMIEQIRKHDPLTSHKDIREKLKELTGYPADRFKALDRAIRFSDSVLEEVDKGILNWSHLIQIEESFVEPAYTQYPDLIKAFSKEEARRRLLKKARSKVLSGTRALMYNVVPAIARAQSENEKEFVEKLLQDFLQNDEMAAEDILKKYEQRFPESDKDVVEIGNLLFDRVKELNNLLMHIQVSSLKGYPKLSKKITIGLKDLKNVIGRILSKIGRGL